MAASARSRAGTCRVRTVPRSVQVSGMMLRAVPAWMAPTVTTQGWTGATSRETTVCSCVTRWQAATIGSTVVVRIGGVAGLAVTR